LYSPVNLRRAMADPTERLVCARAAVHSSAPGTESLDKAMKTIRLPDDHFSLEASSVQHSDPDQVRRESETGSPDMVDGEEEGCSRGGPRRSCLEEGKDRGPRRKRGAQGGREGCLRGEPAAQRLEEQAIPGEQIRPPPGLEHVVTVEEGGL
jgi:hypothetical protein